MRRSWPTQLLPDASFVLLLSSIACNTTSAREPARPDPAAASPERALDAPPTAVAKAPVRSEPMNTPVPSEPAAPAESREELLKARLSRCDLDRIPAYGGGRSIAVTVEANPALADDEESWTIHAARAPGESVWHAGIARSPPVLEWRAEGAQQALVVQHGGLVGRALTLRTTGPRGLTIRVQSFTDSGPPFLFDWTELRAAVTQSDEGRLFVRVRGFYNFEGQGRSEGAICAVVPAPP
jgi:hypothetical protein